MPRFGVQPDGEGFWRVVDGSRAMHPVVGGGPCQGYPRLQVPSAGTLLPGAGGEPGRCAVQLPRKSRAALSIEMLPPGMPAGQKYAPSPAVWAGGHTPSVTSLHLAFTGPIKVV